MDGDDAPDLFARARRLRAYSADSAAGPDSTAGTDPRFVLLQPDTPAPLPDASAWPGEPVPAYEPRPGEPAQAYELWPVQQPEPAAPWFAGPGEPAAARPPRFPPSPEPPPFVPGFPDDPGFSRDPGLPGAPDVPPARGARTGLTGRHYGVLALAVAILAGAVLTAVLLLDRNTDDRGRTAGTAGSPLPSDAVVTGGPDPANPNPSASTDPAPGSVAVDPSVPDSTALRSAVTTLTSYFDGINSRDYRGAYAGLTPRYQQRYPFDEWSRPLATTQDSQIVITGFETTGDGTADATVTFVSRQDAGYGRADAPSETCTVWALHYLFEAAPGGTGYLIDRTTTTGLPAARAC